MSCGLFDSFPDEFGLVLLETVGKRAFPRTLSGAVPTTHQARTGTVRLLEARQAAASSPGPDRCRDESRLQWIDAIQCSVLQRLATICLKTSKQFFGQVRSLGYSSHLGSRCRDTVYRTVNGEEHTSTGTPHHSVIFNPQIGHIRARNILQRSNSQAT